MQSLSDLNYVYFFGDNLSNISNRADIIPDVSSYGGRSLGGVKCPGVIIDEFAQVFSLLGIHLNYNLL